MSQVTDFKQDKSDILTALSNLSLSADKLIFATGENSFSTTALTSTGKSIISATDVKAIRKLLGVYKHLIYDECENVWQLNGNPAVSNGELVLDGASYIQTAKSFTLGGEIPFTIEAKAKINNVRENNTPCIFILFNTSDERLRVCVNPSEYCFTFVGRNNAANWAVWDTPTSSDKVYHLSISYDCKKVYFFFDGQLINSAEVNVTQLEYGLGIGDITGWAPGNFHLEGTVDEVRLSNTCRYTQNFTPVERFEIDEHTLSLLHFD